MNKLECPYCNTVIFDDEKEIYDGSCVHFISFEEDYVDWGEYGFVSSISSIIESYSNHPNFSELTKLIDDLKIKKNIKITEYWDEFEFEQEIESLSSEITIIDSYSEGQHPGGGGITKYLFIGDKDKVKWIFDDLKTLYKRLDLFHKENNV
tara:strand:- start:820 stop:1272 length:453 start_codon:yes stop_codon:yes gene_type:complete